MEQLSFALSVIAPEEHRRQVQQKPRRCLSCQQQFPSTGPGNRVCGDCKELEAWKIGAAEFSVVNVAF